MQRLALVLILTVICGCSSAPPKTEAPASSISPTVTAPSPAPPSTPPDGRPVIVCFGDSLTAGLGVDYASNYPSNMQRDLDAEGYKYRVVNMGVSGETTKDGLARINRVIETKPALVIVEFGGNDGLRGLPVSDTQKNLDAIIAHLTKNGIRVAMAGITLPPNYGAQYVAQFNGMYPAVAKKYNVPLLPFIYKDVYGVPGYIQEDGVHATIEGNVQVAKNVEGFIKPLLKK